MKNQKKTNNKPMPTLNELFDLYEYWVGVEAKLEQLQNMESEINSDYFNEPYLKNVNETNLKLHLDRARKYKEKARQDILDMYSKNN